MQRQLQELERKTREMRSSMERIAAKEKYQMRQIDEENERRSGNERNSKWRYNQKQGCQMAKFDPTLSLDCARVEGVGAQP